MFQCLARVQRRISVALFFMFLLTIFNVSIANFPLSGSMRSVDGPLRTCWSKAADRGNVAPLRLRGGAMSFLAAYMLLKIGGNENPTEDDVKGLLNSVGAAVDDDLIKKVVTELDGKDINDLIEKGKLKMEEEDQQIAGAARAAEPGGGEAAVQADENEKAGKGGDKGGDKGGGKGKGKDDKKEEEKKEEKKESEGSDMDMGFGLFD